MAETKIEWTATTLPDGTLLPGYTFNPWVGCQAVSAACDHCYAEALVKRYGGDFATRRRTAPANWRKPMAWDREAAASGIRRKVFCASMADVFDNKVSIDWRVDLWTLISGTPHLDWLLLTKRPQNIAKMLPGAYVEQMLMRDVPWGNGWPNVWLGTTVENQTEADRRIPHLLSVPARVRFLSCEPLLSDLDIRWALSSNRLDIAAGFLQRRRFSPGLEALRPLDWTIGGGESGPHRRRVDLAHMRSLRDQCAAAGIPFFGKQDDKIHPLPPDLMVRQFPDVATAR